MKLAGFLLTTRVSNLLLLPLARPVRGLLCHSAPGNLDKHSHMHMVLGLMEFSFEVRGNNNNFEFPPILNACIYQSLEPYNSKTKLMPQKLIGIKVS